jgi:hypothetical protein
MQRRRREEGILRRTPMLERETGFEPATLALARRCSTTELFPLNHNPSEGWDSTDARTKLSSDLVGHT